MRIILNERPNLLTELITDVVLLVILKFNGPSANGLKNNFFSSL